MIMRIENGQCMKYEGGENVLYSVLYSSMWLSWDLRKQVKIDAGG
jgi:hypothetical protein